VDDRIHLENPMANFDPSSISPTSYEGIYLPSIDTKSLKIIIDTLYALDKGTSISEIIMSFPKDPIFQFSLLCHMEYLSLPKELTFPMVANE
jgi:hypothetical protein